MRPFNEITEAEVQRWWKQAEAKVVFMMERLGGKSPHATTNGVYDDARHDWWTSGFWPGIQWLLYDMTGQEKYREGAWSWDERIEQCFLRENRFHHDVGFQFLSTAVFKYKLTGDTDAKRRALQAAGILAGRFNLAGRFIRAQNQADRPGGSIIDTMMNLSLLFWASQESRDPRFAQIARAHADTTMRYALREDGASHHVTVFDAETGELKEYQAGQGDSPTSSWSRGQAWAIYGFANTSRFTGDVRYLKAAQRTAHYFISCLPEDHVAHWDFRVREPGSDEPRDSSAAAIAASGLLEIAAQLPPEEGRLYQTAAERIIKSLSENYSTFERTDQEGILLGGTGHKPAGRDINVSLIYGDYYYVEALAKLNGWKNRIY